MPPAILKFAAGVILPPHAYLDTNFIIHARDNASAKYGAASACLGELLRQRIQLNISALVIDELWWAYLRKSFQLSTGLRLTAEMYKARPDIVRTHWPAVQRVMDVIRGWGGFRELPTAVGVITEAEGLMRTNSLLPRDAFHLALAVHHRVDSFVTADSDFDTAQLPDGTKLVLIKI